MNRLLSRSRDVLGSSAAILVLLILLASILGLVFAPATSSAAVPAPPLSTVPPCLTVCPAGDRPFSVVVRDIAGLPIPGSTVEIHLANCPEAVVALCADCAQPAAYNPVTRTFTRITDATGTATFQICGSVYCPTAPGDWAQVRADGVILRTCRFVTTDPDGDLDVDGNDVAIVLAAVGGPPAHYDQNCDTIVDAADVDAVEAHRGHACPGVVPAGAASWGRVKSTYR